MEPTDNLHRRHFIMKSAALTPGLFGLSAFQSSEDDKWLLAVDPAWSKQRPLNTYWKWFHVCEHESNHRGQMTWQKSRLSGVKPSKD